MSKIYTIKDEKSGKDMQLVSKEYVDLRIKAVKDSIINHIRNIDTAHRESTESNENFAVLDSTEYEDISDVVNTDEYLKASDVIQDSTHRFVTDEQIKNLNNKASIFEVNNIINDAKNELQALFNNQYISLLNSPVKVEELKALTELIKNKDSLKDIMTVMGIKADRRELLDHKGDYTHLNEEDREALNLLLEKYNSGDLADIGVKCIHADVAKTAMNALSLNNMNISDLHKCKREELVIGLVDNYKIDEVDVLVDKSYDLEKVLGSLSGGIILFKNGKYENSISLSRNSNSNTLIIEGCGNGTTFVPENNKDIFYDGNIIIKNCVIGQHKTYQTNIEIGDRVRFENVKFVNCRLTFNGSSFSAVKDCEFNWCKIVFNNGCTYLKFVDNYLYETKLPKYINRSCVFRDNVIVK